MFFRSIYAPLKFIKEYVCQEKVIDWCLFSFNSASMWPSNNVFTTSIYSWPNGSNAFKIISFASSNEYLIFKLLSNGTPKSYKWGSSISSKSDLIFKYFWIRPKLLFTDSINLLIISGLIFSSNNIFSKTELYFSKIEFSILKP